MMWREKNSARALGEKKKRVVFWTRDKKKGLGFLIFCVLCLLLREHTLTPHTRRNTHHVMSALRRTIRGRIKSLLVVIFLLSRILVFFFFFFFFFFWWWWWWRPDVIDVFCGLYVSFFLIFPILFFSQVSLWRENVQIYVLYPWDLVVVGLVRISFCYLGIVRTRVLILQNAFYWCSLSLSLMNKQ